MQNRRIIWVLFLIYFTFAILLNSVGTVILQVINNYGVSKSAASVLEGFKDLPIAVVSFLVASFLPRERAEVQHVPRADLEQAVDWVREVGPEQVALVIPRFTDLLWPALALRDDAGRCIEVGFLDGVSHFVERDASSRKALGVQLHLELTQIAAEPLDGRDTRDGEQTVVDLELREIAQRQREEIQKDARFGSSRLARCPSLGRRGEAASHRLPERVLLGSRAAVEPRAHEREAGDRVRALADFGLGRRCAQGAGRRGGHGFLPAAPGSRARRARPALTA